VGLSNITGASNGDWITSGTLVTLTATQNPANGAGSRYDFRNWTGDVVSPPNATNPLTFSMTAAKSITANYATQYLLTLATNPSSVAISNISGGSGGSWYDSGTPLSLQATATVTIGTDVFNFRNWTGDVASPPNTANPISLSMTQARSITANYNTAPTFPGSQGSGVNAVYSDPMPTITVTVTDADSAGSALSQSTQWKYTSGGFGTGLPSSLTSGLPTGLSIAVTTTTAHGRSWEITGAPQVPAGVYTIRVTVSDGDGGSRYLEIPLTVSKESMTIDYTGPNFLNTSSVGGSVAIPLSAKYTEEQDSNLGAKSPWSTIPLRGVFKVYDSAMTSQLFTCTVTINQTAAQQLAGSGTAGPTGCSPSLPAGVYVIQIELETNGYYGANAVQNVSVTVGDPGTGKVTGGGWILDPNTNDKSNFGFVVQFDKKGIKGNSVFIYRRTVDLAAMGVTGAPSGLRAYNFIVKTPGNGGMDSLNDKCTSNTKPVEPCFATFFGKANIKVVDRLTGIQYSLGAGITGNQVSFQIDVTDNGEPGASSSTNPDSYAIRILTSTGTYYQVGTSSTSLDARGTQITLSGGNIQVHL
jgi:hypothetical protein